MTDAAETAAREQAALRRIATLVAEGATADELFSAVAREVAPVVGVAASIVDRFEPDGGTLTLAVAHDPDWAAADSVAYPGRRWPREPGTLSDLVCTTRRVVRIDCYAAGLKGVLGEAARAAGVGSCCASPIIVDGSVWGLIGVFARAGEALLSDAEARLQSFTELVAAAIANSEARAEVERLTEERAALQRVAMLIADGAASDVLFAAVAKEVAQIFEASAVTLLRYEPDQWMTVVAALNDPLFPVGSRWSLDAASVAATVFETGHAAQVADYANLSGTLAEAVRESGFRSAFGAPITVGGSVWGVIWVGSRDLEPMPADTEARLTAFSELLATAISNAEASDRVGRLADEQSSLRRVATLVAEGVTAEALFGSVVQEVSDVLDVPMVSLDRYESEAETVTLASWGEEPGFQVGSRWRLDGPSVRARVLATGRPARIDDYSELSGTVAAAVRAEGRSASAGAPIVVEGRVWGVLTVTVFVPDQLTADIETRLGAFTELIAAAIANAESREARVRLADEQAALRRVATLVAQGSSPEDVFWALIEEVRAVLGCDAASLLRYHDDFSRTELADTDFEIVGERTPLGGHNASTLVYETGRPVRIDDYARDATGPSADHAHQSGWRSCVAVPVQVEGSLWGVVMAASRTEKPLPADAEERLAKFTELIATAISRTQAHDDLRRLAEEQAALRRVAILVAEAAPPTEIFAAVAREVAELLHVPAISMVRFEPDGSSIQVGPWGENPFAIGTRFDPGQGVIGLIWDTGRPARVDSYASLEGPVVEALVAAGVRSSVGAPIVVDGRTWGAIAALSTSSAPLQAGAEDRLASFTELVATAIANSQAHEQLTRLADEQAALRRVATLVAEVVTADQLFWSVANEVGHVLGVPGVVIDRFEPDGTAVTVALATDPDWEIARQIVYLGRRWSREDEGLSRLVWTTGRPARVDSYSGLEGGTAQDARSAGVGSGCGTPIVVDGRLWGMIRVFTRGADALPDDAEERLQDFTELVAAALSNAQASRDLNEIATAQAALRRVATLVAKGAQAEELLSGVASEVAQVLGVSGAQVDRYEADGTAVVLATWRDAGWEAIDSVLPVGMRFTPDPGTLAGAIQSTGHSARIEDYSDVPGLIGESSRAAGIGAACAAPIVVDGKLWGAIRAFSRKDEVLAADAESRLEGFTELVATAISNSQAHDDLADLADEQAALRRLATLVAQGAESGEVFDAVCAEAGRLLGAASVNLSHYTSDGLNVTMAGWSLRDTHVPVGTSFALAPDTIGGAIVATGEPARMDSWSDATSELAVLVRERGARSSVGAPVVVEGRLWGALVAATDSDEPLPTGTELRLARLTELIATAISNATTRIELIASRARIVAAGDEARRRIERNLHDGTQQRLIALGLDLQALEATIPPELGSAHEGFERMTREIESVLEEVRELSRGLHPAQLARGGLGPSLRALVRRSPIPVELEVDVDGRLPASVETAVYYVVSEALTNAIRYSGASAISVTVGREGDMLCATVADDGGGGAEPGVGSGLIGLSDRVEALGGRFSFSSPRASGTRISIELPATVAATP